VVRLSNHERNYDTVSKGRGLEELTSSPSNGEDKGEGFVGKTIESEIIETTVFVLEG
jgi:hypothetical protein